MQIDPNTQAPLGSTLSEEMRAPAPRAGGRKKKGRRIATTQVDGMADVGGATAEVTAGGASVIESTDLEAVVRRLRSGAYNTREVAEVIARRLLASGDL